MKRFFHKIDPRKWRRQNPYRRTKNEIDSIMTDKKQIFRNVSILNEFSTDSNHRMAKASIDIDHEKERYHMIKKKSRSTLVYFENTDIFQSTSTPWSKVRKM